MQDIFAAKILPRQIYIKMKFHLSNFLHFAFLNYFLHANLRENSASLHEWLDYISLTYKRNRGRKVKGEREKERER